MPSDPVRKMPEQGMRMEAALRESEQRYRLLFEGMLEGFALHEIICDADGRPVDYRFLDMNPAFEKLTGLRAKDVVGKTVLQVFPATEAYWIDIYGQVALTGQPANFENYSKDLNAYYRVRAFSPLKMHFAVLFEDITERKRAEEGLRVAKEKAEAASKFKSELLSNISHDLRTPMNAILGFSSMLGTVDSVEKRVKYIDIIQSKAKSLLALIENILDGAMMESGHVCVRSVVFDLERILNEVVDTARLQAGEKKLNISCAMGKLPQLKGDDVRVGQILANLLSNAVKYTDEGEILVHALCACEKYDPAKCRVRISVKDTGLGIPQEKLPFIYDAFARFHEFEGGKPHEGVGLGLYITRKLIDLMGGDIQVASVVGQGTEFVVTLTFQRVL